MTAMIPTNTIVTTTMPPNITANLAPLESSRLAQGRQPSWPVVRDNKERSGTESASASPSASTGAPGSAGLDSVRSAEFDAVVSAGSDSVASTAVGGDSATPLGSSPRAA